LSSHSVEVSPKDMPKNLKDSPIDDSKIQTSKRPQDSKVLKQQMKEKVQKYSDKIDNRH
jgi:hypothetical protein